MAVKQRSYRPLPWPRPRTASSRPRRPARCFGTNLLKTFTAGVDQANAGGVPAKGALSVSCAPVTAEPEAGPTPFLNKRGL
eukprot:scaffold72694_cov75-Phaeocystis_antarctica.AAC.3